MAAWTVTGGSIVIEMKKLRVVFLSPGGADRVLEHLCRLESIELVGVFVESETQPRRSLRERISRSIFYDGQFETAKKVLSTIFRKPRRTERGLRSIQEDRRVLESLCAELKVPYFEVDDYHSSETIERLKDSDIDLFVLYGTNIIRESVFGIPRRGTINLHQGLAPYYRGGPPIFWELLNGEDKVGITIHYVSAKVDAGDIILQETAPMNYDFSRYGLEYESFLRDRAQSLAEPSAILMTQAVKLIAEGRDQPVKQDLSVGKRYRLPSKREKNILIETLRKRRTQRKTKDGGAHVK